MLGSFREVGRSRHDVAAALRKVADSATEEAVVADSDVREVGRSRKCGKELWAGRNERNGS